MTLGGLFENTEKTHRDVSSDEERINLASHRLAVVFAEEDKLPSRYRRSAIRGQKKQRGRTDSGIDKRFRANVQAWKVLIEVMLAKIDDEQAWRFINLSPKMDGTIRIVTENSDFVDFMDYLILRRDIEQCDADELGGLAQLSTAFQRQIEKTLEEEKEQSEQFDGEGLGSAGAPPSPSS